MELHAIWVLLYNLLPCRQGSYVSNEVIQIIFHYHFEIVIPTNQEQKTVHVKSNPLAEIISILIWLDSFPLLSQRIEQCIICPIKLTGSKPRRLPVLTAVSRVNFLLSFFHKKDISWIIIRIEIKMKSSALSPINLPRFIDRSNLSPRRFASRLGDKFDRSMTLGKLLGNNALLFIFIS